MDIVLLDKDTPQAILMFIDSARQIIGHASIQNGIMSICHDVNAVLFTYCHRNPIHYVVARRVFAPTKQSSVRRVTLLDWRTPFDGRLLRKERSQRHANGSLLRRRAARNDI